MRGALTGQRYVDDILQPHVGPFLNYLPVVLFQQYNARPNTARVAQDFLRHFQTLPWPARSPDLSPVEKVILRLLNEDKMPASTSSRVCSSSMFLMKWNGIMESFLIDEVEKLPYLWNPRHPHFTKRLKKIGFQQIAMRMSERWPALEAFLTPEVCIAKFKNLRTYYRNEKQKLSSFRSGTGARDLVPKWEHFARFQFLDDTIQPLDSISNLDNMELEVNATSLNGPSESELPQRIRVFTSTPVSTSTPPVTTSTPPVTTSTPPVTTSTPPVTTSTPRAKKRKVESSQEAFYESMQKCLGAVGKKTVNETFAAFIASELDNLPCPKQQVAVRRKLCATLFECLEENLFLTILAMFFFFKIILYKLR
ncbi:DDE_3 domain-containing protein [Trichonephila clavipes]|nr:DDE_3 domain-containing protein [Trichonephila clavipes]